MCFSAGASFGAGILLAAIGAAAITKAKSPSHKLLAVIPFIFSAQQFAESLLWIALTKESFAIFKEPSMYFFLFFAQVVWPVWVPLATMSLEENTRRKKLLRILLGAGIVVSAESAFRLLYHAVDAGLVGHHVMYTIDSSTSLNALTTVLYFLGAVFPPFFSSVKKVWWLGVGLFASYIIAKIFYDDYIISVWCYFAAVISGTILLVIWESEKVRRRKLSLEIG